MKNNKNKRSRNIEKNGCIHNGRHENESSLSGSTKMDFMANVWKNI